MGQISDNIPLLYLGILAAVYLKPEYAIYDSRVITVLLFFTIINVSRAIYQLILYPSYFTPLRDIQTPPGRTLLRGNTDSWFLDTPHARMKEWVKALPNEGLIRYYTVGNFERLTVTSAKALSELLVTKSYEFVKPALTRRALGRAVGYGMLTAEGDDHRWQRKSLMPAFAYRHIKDLYPIFWSKSIEMVRLMRKDLAATTDGVLTVKDYASRATLDIIGVAGMGHDFDSLQNPDNPLNAAYQRIFQDRGLLTKLTFMATVFFGDNILLRNLPTSRAKAVDESGAYIRNVARQMIEGAKAKLADPNADHGVDIISVAIQSGTFDEDNLVEQVMTFLAAGHETTSTALQWSIYALSKNQDVQARLREEVRANLPSILIDNPQAIDATTIDNLPYLHAVCNEVLRFHPSVPMTVREAATDTTLFVISPELVNHMTEFWGPDANEFNPDRWMGPGKANTGGATNNYAFLSFIHGPRSCIGQGFSKSELACLVAAVVGSFAFELQDPNAKLEVREGATAAPRDGVVVKATALEGW
ncbi:hypothetical protein N7470_004063 [Penicillium chermesinum]|nr:hypothetical protein N7470_004063 [Penicillium chermesinum]